MVGGREREMTNGQCSDTCNVISISLEDEVLVVHFEGL